MVRKVLRPQEYHKRSILAPKADVHTTKKEPAEARAHAQNHHGGGTQQQSGKSIIFFCFVDFYNCAIPDMHIQRSSLQFKNFCFSEQWRGLCCWT